MIAKTEFNELKQTLLKLTETDTILRKSVNEMKQYALITAKSTLTFDEVALITGLSKSHLYRLTCTKQIPHYKPSGKYIYFDRNEVEAWMKQNKVITKLEAEQNAQLYTIKKGGLK